jgi:integrase/recombinase XerC
VNIEAFLQFLQTEDRAERTIEGYTRDLEKFLAWFEKTTGRKPEPAIITPLDVREYRRHLQSERRLKPASVNRRLAALRVYFRWATETGLIASNPAMSIKMVPQAERSPRWLERDEVYALLREVDADIRLAKAKKLTPSAELATRNAAIFSLLLHGLRVSEVCALHLEDVTIKDKSGKVIVHAGKGNKYREVPINVDARQTVSEWLQVRPKDSGSYLFTGRRDQKIQPRAVQRFLDKLARRAGLDPAKVTPHACRHTFGKNLVDVGESLDRVAMLMGHKDLSTTAIYTTPSQSDLAAAVDRIAWQD